MEEKFRTKLSNYRLEDTKVIVAVSGGLDSVVLLNLLTKNLNSKNIIVAHFNHGIRSDSDLDEAFVKSLAFDYSLKYRSRKIKPLKKDEGYLRQERYKWLQKTAKKEQAKYIILAHHLDDQLETIILNLTRGAGPLELWGMAELSGNILRPLLQMKKSDLEDYAAKNNLKFVVDETNKDISYARNRVRSLVIGELKKINPSILETVSENIKISNKLKVYVNQEVADLEVMARSGDKLSLSVIKGKPQFLVQELIKKILIEKLKNQKDIYSKNINEVLALIDKPGTKKTTLGGLEIVKDYKWLRFGTRRQSIQEKKKLAVGKEIRFNDFLIKASIGSGSAKINNILLPVEFSDNLEVRLWQKGDKLKAASGTKKLQDIFVDAKVSLKDREKWPVVTYNDEILWLPKLAASHYAKRRNKNLIIEVK